MDKKLIKLALYTTHVGLPIYVVHIHGDIHYFVVYDSTDFNPSNHKHAIELKRCKNIDELIRNPFDFDAQMFNFKLSEIPDISFTFPNHVEWYKIR